jgi:hypothetical protein
MITEVLGERKKATRSLKALYWYEVRANSVWRPVHRVEGSSVHAQLTG